MRITLSCTIPDDYAGQRLDQALAALWPQYSRTRLKSWLENGYLTLNGQTAKPRQKILGGEQVQLDAPDSPQANWSAQALPLDLIYEDEALLVINKAHGVVTHPAPGHLDHTLVNALIHHCPTLQTLPRAGLIHRLDKDTTGLLVVAKTLEAHHHLVKALQKRAFNREYEALVKGELTGGGRIETFMGRDPRDRTRMAVTPSGKVAITHYRILTRFRGFTHLKIKLETGRTHQIRVHLAHLRHPILGDPTYGQTTLPKSLSAELKNHLSLFKRQALHAKKLGLHHPITGEYHEWEAPLPEDMQALLNALSEHNDTLPD